MNEQYSVKPVADVIRDIEAQVRRLEGGELTLEEAMDAFENGLELIRDIQTRLSELELKVQSLGKDKFANDVEDTDRGVNKEP